MILGVVAFAPIAWADGVSASAMSVSDGGLRDARVHLGAAVGSDGPAVAIESADHFAFVSTNWTASDIEAGLGLTWWLTGPLRLYLGTGWIVYRTPQFGGGGRVLVGLSSRFGHHAFIRPGVAASFAMTGEERAISYSLPIEASVEAGYTWPFLSIYGRVAGRVTALTHSGSLSKVEGSVNVAVPFGL